jgi:hypothetical protein
MKLTFDIFRRSRLAVATVFCISLALPGAVTLADRGRGSIRAAARPAPVARGPARAAPAPRPEPVARGGPPEVRAGPPARVEAPAQREWDDNDEDAQHWGDFGHGTVVRAYRGQRIHALPPAAHFHVVFDHHDYFCDDDGIFYQQDPGGDYVVVQPPVGAIIPALPEGAVAIVVGPTTYYYLDGVFYVAQDGGYAVVNPPSGIVVPMLPEGADMLISGVGVVNYQFNGFNYQPSIQNGVTVYTVNPM